MNTTTRRTISVAFAAVFALACAVGSTGCTQASAASYGKLTGSGSSSSGTGLTPIPGNTALCNPTGDAGIPTSCTGTQLRTLQGIQQVSSTLLAALADAQTLCGTALTAYAGSDFGDLSNVDTTSTITGGTVTLSTTATGGVVKVASNATASGAGRIRLTGDGALVDNSKTSKWYFVTRFKFPAGMDVATDAKIRIAAANGGNTVYEFGQRGVTQTTNFNIFITDSGGTNIVNASSGVALDTAWHTLKLYNEGTNLIYSLDGTAIKTQVLSGLAGGDPVYMEVFSRNAGTAANREIDLDYWWFVSTPN